MSDNNPLILTRLAIDAAINCRWDEAVEQNKILLEIEPENVDCLNRLAKAYFELGTYTEAKKLYQKVLELDPYNTIAEKNLKKVNTIKKDGNTAPNHNPMIMSASFFLQEPGTSKLVNLVKVAEPQKLLTLSAGTLVNLNPKNRGITVTDNNNTYLGALPDDIAHNLLKFLKGGNKYQSFIKSVKSNGITILIRETVRAKRFKNQASFLDESKILSFSSDHISILNEDSSSGTDGEDDGIVLEENLS